MIKKVNLLLLAVVFGFFFMGVVNADEENFSDVASLASVIGGPEEEITPTGTGSYKFYYKVQAIDSNDFNSYIKSKYVYDNGDDTSDDYVNAQSRVVEYEETFYNLIPTVSNTAGLDGWTESTDNQINLTGLNYAQGQHNGYVLGVVAVEGTKIYGARLILESTSTTTLENISYLDSDKSTYEENTNDVVAKQETKTNSNPETGIEDYVMYLVPLSIVLGSGILLRKNNA